MPSATKRSSQADAGEPQPSFEEALKKLESIVESMESGDLPLETLIQRYEDGVRMATVCQAKLAEAEVRIQQLEKSAAGEFQLKPFDTDTAGA